MAYATVYIVSEDADIRDSLVTLVASAGLESEPLPSLAAWIEAAGPEPRGCLVVDAGAGELAGPERLARFTLVCARIPVVVLIDRGDITTAVHAIRQGAAYVQQKPYGNGNLLEYIKQALAVLGAGGVRPADTPNTYV